MAVAIGGKREEVHSPEIVDLRRGMADLRSVMERFGSVIDRMEEQERDREGDDAGGCGDAE